MLNFMVLVGKVKEIPEIRLTAAGTKIATMLLEVDRGFRNSNGEYDQDVFNVVLWRGIAETCAGFTASRFGCRGERPAAGAQLRAEGGADVLQRGDRGGKGFVYFSEIRSTIRR